MKKEGKLRMVGRRVDADTSLRLHQERLAVQQRSPARQVKDHYDAKMAKLEYEKAAAQVVEIATVQREWQRALTAAKTALLGIGRQLSPRLVNIGVLQIQSLIDQAVINALRRLAHPEHYPMEKFEAEVLHNHNPKEAHS
jgi:hypothetical protein